VKTLANVIGALGLLAAAILAAPEGEAQTRFRPVAVVNDSAITGFDLAQRAQIMVVLGFSAATPDALRTAALDELVEDRLKLQAGKAMGITATPEMVQGAIDEIAKARNLSAPEFMAMMNNQGVSNMAVTDLAAAESVWRQVVRARFASRVQPGEAEIDAEIALMRQQGNVEYRMLEIGLPLVTDGRTEEQTRALAEQLYERLKAGGDFRAAVKEYSQAPSAARGGDVGWVSTQRMPAGLRAAIGELEVGQISAPLSVPGGISLLKLIDKRSGGSLPGGDDTDLRERIRTQLIVRKSARLAEGLLQELRRDALIDVR
jgi:peptidyl-prolyl cis-trans isomerase SurA